MEDNTTNPIVVFQADYLKRIQLTQILVIKLVAWADRLSSVPGAEEVVSDMLDILKFKLN